MPNSIKKTEKIMENHQFTWEMRDLSSRFLMPFLNELG